MCQISCLKAAPGRRYGGKPHFGLSFFRGPSCVCRHCFAASSALVYRHCSISSLHGRISVVFSQNKLFYFIKNTCFNTKIFGGRGRDPLTPQNFFTKMLVFHYVIKNTHSEAKNFRGRVGTPWEPPPKIFFHPKFLFSST